LEWRHTTDRGSVEPAIEAVGLACTHDLRKVLCEFDCYSYLTMLSFKVREQLRVGIRAFHGLLQHQPCGAACGQRHMLPLPDERERLAWAVLTRP
jgi:hypothetical protein